MSIFIYFSRKEYTMLENILLSAAYYESFSKFASSLKPNKTFTVDEMANIAAETVEAYYVSASDTGASKEDIESLGEDLLLHVLAELENQPSNDENNIDVKDLESEIFNNLINEIDL